MNDFALLDRLDRILKKELSKNYRTQNLKIKRFKRTFYEIKKFPKNKKKKMSYILNYGLKDVDLIKFLYKDFDEKIRRANTEKKTIAAYNSFTNKRLRTLLLDETRFS